jgi:uncharacterized protein YlxP (DUF503 family)
MFVGVYRIEIHLPAAQSLKAKRSVVNGLKARLGQLNLAVAEVDGQDLWQRSTLGAAAVSSDPHYLEDLTERIRAVVDREPRAMLLRIGREVTPVEP